MEKHDYIKEKIMSNKFRDIFTSDYKSKLKQIHQEFIDNRECFVCKHCIDISDERNTCHLCEYTNDLIPQELTCLLWEVKDES